MKNFFGVLITVLCFQAGNGQVTDTIRTDKIHLNDIIIKGDIYTDPTFTVEII